VNEIDAEAFYIRLSADFPSWTSRVDPRLPLCFQEFTACRDLAPSPNAVIPQQRFGLMHH